MSEAAAIYDDGLDESDKNAKAHHGTRDFALSWTLDLEDRCSLPTPRQLHTSTLFSHGRPAVTVPQKGPLNPPLAPLSIRLRITCLCTQVILKYASANPLSEPSLGPLPISHPRTRRSLTDGRATRHGPALDSAPKHLPPHIRPLRDLSALGTRLPPLRPTLPLTSCPTPSPPRWTHTILRYHSGDSAHGSRLQRVAQDRRCSRARSSKTIRVTPANLLSTPHPRARA